MSIEPEWFSHDNFLQAFVKRQLFGMKIVETDEMFRRGCKDDEIFCVDIHGCVTDYILPCFCIKGGDDTVQLLWVHPKFRGKGLGRHFVSKLNVKDVWNPLDHSKGFWLKCGF